MSEKNAKAKRRIGELGYRSAEEMHEFFKKNPTSTAWSDAGFRWFEEKISRRRPYFVFVDDTEDFIDVTASEVPKELEYYEHRD